MARYTITNTVRNNLGMELCQWHASGGDPIYQTGSHLIAQIDPPIPVCHEALRNMVTNMIEADAKSRDLTLSPEVREEHTESAFHASGVIHDLAAYIEERMALEIRANA